MKQGGSFARHSKHEHHEKCRIDVGYQNATPHTHSDESIDVPIRCANYSPRTDPQYLQPGQQLLDEDHTLLWFTVSRILVAVRVLPD